MTMKKQISAQPDNSPQASGVSSGGRRLEDETPLVAHNSLDPVPDVQVKLNQRSPRRQFSVAYKLNILEQYEACSNALGRGSLLRKEGIYTSRIYAWRKQRDEGKLSVKIKGQPSKSALNSQQLTRENTRLKKKLAQAEAIIDLQKKVSDLLQLHILPLEYSETS